MQNYRSQVRSSVRMTAPAVLAGAAAFLVGCSQPAAPERTELVAVAPANCADSSPVSGRVGSVVPFRGASAGVICVAGGEAGAEYVLVLSNTAAAAATAQLTITASGVEPPLFALGAEPAGGALIASSGAPVHGDEAHGDGGFHDRLRRIERESLTPLMSSAQAWADRSGLASAGTAALQVSAPEVGTLLPLNVQSKRACTEADVRTGRVMAVSQRAVLVADTANPAGGFVAADYQVLAAAFDTLISPVVTANFGQPTDIDGNGRVIIFYTRAVNELTPRNADYVIGGFVFARDLYPRQAGNGLTGCETSNVAEMFYMLAPDPGGVVNGNVRSADYVRRTTTGTLAHEYQHLLNAGQRLYVTRAGGFEATWLDEGLAHIAEELVFHRASGLGPLQKLGAQQIRASQQRLDAYNSFQTANTGRFETFLKDPAAGSPWAAGDALPTRGASWNLLRYLADRRGGDQAETWRRLSAGPAAGTANLAGVFGSDMTGMLADWHVALIADGAVAGLSALHTSPSWDLRSVFAMHGRQSYPARPATLWPASPAEVTLAGGGAAYYTVRVPAGGIGRIDTRVVQGALPAGVVGSLIRTR
jgi:hypothetical protein